MKAEIIIKNFDEETKEFKELGVILEEMKNPVRAINSDHEMVSKSAQVIT